MLPNIETLIPLTERRQDILVWSFICDYQTEVVDASINNSKDHSAVCPPLVSRTTYVRSAGSYSTVPPSTIIPTNALPSSKKYTFS